MNWLRQLLSGKPHYVIGGADNPYLYRWNIIPRNRLFGIYLHKFMRDDDDRALHDHPWSFLSIMLRGQYVEFTDKGSVLRTAGSIAFRRGTHKHRIVLPREIVDGIRKPVPCWTIIIKGPVYRKWGFWCPKGFVHWKDFVAEDDKGNIGRGCGEMS